MRELDDEDDGPSDVKEAIARAEAILPGVKAPNGESDPRWQALIQIGYWIEDNPEEVWNFVVRWVSADDEDLRTGIGFVLVEHLLDYHFDLIFPRVEELALTDRQFAHTFSTCWSLGQAELPGNRDRFDALSAKCRMSG